MEEKTEGRYTISVYPSEQLAGGELVKGVEMLLTGSTDIALNSVMNTSSFDRCMERSTDLELFMLKFPEIIGL